MPTYRYASVLPAVLVGLLLIGLLVVWVTRGQEAPPADVDAANPASGSDTYRARVVDIVETGEIELCEGLTQPYQIASIQMLEGPIQGVTFQIDYGRRQVRPAGTGLRPGEQILVTIAQAPGQLPEAFFVDWVRTPPLGWLLAAFVGLSLLISSWKGVAAWSPWPRAC